MFDLGCFSSHQVYAWQPNFDRNNFVRWTRKGLLVRLRQGYYTFPEYKSKPDFKNDFGEYAYKNVRGNLMFGYDLKPLVDGRTLQLANPEKALLDLLYLFPFYASETDLEELRLDKDFMQDDFDLNRMEEYLSQFKNKTLEKRVKLLVNPHCSLECLTA